jgi:hypothetical protein
MEEEKWPELDFTLVKTIVEPKSHPLNETKIIYRDWGSGAYGIYKRSYKGYFAFVLDYIRYKILRKKQYISHFHQDLGDTIIKNTTRTFTPNNYKK